MSFDLLDIAQIWIPFGQEAPSADPVMVYFMDGPTTGTVGFASNPFTVSLGPGSLADPVTVTPHVSGGGVGLSPLSVVLTNTARTASFTYEAASTGPRTISVTNDGGLDNPPPIVFTAALMQPVPDLGTSPVAALKPGPLFRPGRAARRNPPTRHRLRIR